MSRLSTAALVLGAVSAAYLAAWSQAPAAPAATTIAGYNPKVDPSKFSTNITNKYFPLKRGTVHRYQGKRDGKPTLHVMTVTHRTRTVMGVKCVVIEDVVTQNQSLVEKTTDWYAQDSSGNVWYFGEDTAEYQNGVVTSTAGTWEAGVDKALPGIVMPSVPMVGKTYQQEWRPGVALDKATILNVNGTAHTPTKTYTHLVVTYDQNPLDPSKKEHKYFAPGVGFVFAVLAGGGHNETTWLVK